MIITLEKIEKRFKDTTVIKNLNLIIKNGEFFTFVGPSGCGKTTILNIIAGLVEVSSGIIYFDGQPVNNLPPGKRNIAMVFQNYALYPHMSVYDNIAFPLKIQKLPKPKIDKEIRKVAKLLGLNNLLKRKPKELSGGQKQRVALGRAIIRKPKAFLMDEPLSNLDATLRVEMRTELKKLHQKLQITTVYVTHDQEEAMVLSDRMAVLHNGEILQCAPPLEIYKKPATLFVAKFVGTPPMNFIEGNLLYQKGLFQEILEKFKEKNIIVGIRPQDITINNSETKESLKANILLIEPTGSNTWVDCEWNKIKIRGKAANGEKISKDQHAFVKIPINKLHLFDKNSQKRLLYKF